jgi:hypothetical protein
MSPSRRSQWLLLALSAAMLLSGEAPSFASINWVGTSMVPSTVPKSCSGAFRYAARDGNGDIMPLSPVQAFANDRLFARTRYAARAMSGLEPERSRVLALNAMCGAR